MNKLSIVSFSECQDGPAVWDDIVKRSKDAWFYHCYSTLEFILATGEKYESQNQSFFIFLGEKAVGLVPFVLEKTVILGQEFREASYCMDPLPWPCFDVSELEKAQLSLSLAEDFAFDELERRAKLAKLGRVRVCFSPPSSSVKEDFERTSRIILERKYLDNSINSHLMDLKPDCLSLVRDRYRRYHKKFSPLFDMSICEGNVSPELEEQYFKLHVMDAGGQFRSRKSYEKQANVTRHGDGFFVVATHKEKNEVVGMLLINLVKNAAFDTSVAVNPAFQDMYVSHLMKWKAIEELLRRGVPTYELGEIAELPRVERLYSTKQRGISHFKEGWARKGQKRVYVAEKFLDEKFLQACSEEKVKNLNGYFELNSETL